MSVSGEEGNGRTASYSDPRNLNPTFYRLLIWELAQSDPLANDIWHSLTWSTMEFLCKISD